jgi:hypothetical protein
VFFSAGCVVKVQVKHPIYQFLSSSIAMMITVIDTVDATNQTGLMGSASSKAARVLPRSKSSTRPTTSPLDAFGRTQQKPPSVGETKGQGMLSLMQTKTQRVQSERPQAIQDDGMDPQLLANLTRLGPVKVDHGMHGLKLTGVTAGRILDMQKQSEMETRTRETKRNHLQAPTLFDALMRLQEAKDERATERLAEEYNLDAWVLRELGKTVNVPTPDETTTRAVIGEDGAEIVLKTVRLVS